MAKALALVGRIAFVAKVAFAIIGGIWRFSGAAAPLADISQGLAENPIGVVCCFALLMAPAAFTVAIKAVLATAKPGD